MSRWLDILVNNAGIIPSHSRNLDRKKAARYAGHRSGEVLGDT
jgi:hypothetical protein